MVDVEHGDAAGVQRALDVGGEAVCEPARMIGWKNGKEQ